MCVGLFVIFFNGKGMSKYKWHEYLDTTKKVPKPSGTNGKNFWGICASYFTKITKLGYSISSPRKYKLKILPTNDELKSHL